MSYRTFAWLGHLPPSDEQRLSAGRLEIDIDYIGWRDPTGYDPLLGIAGFYDGVFSTDPIIAALAVKEEMAVAGFHSINLIKIVEAK